MVKNDRMRLLNVLVETVCLFWE